MNDIKSIERHAEFRSVLFHVVNVNKAIKRRLCRNDQSLGNFAKESWRARLIQWHYRFGA